MQLSIFFITQMCFNIIILSTPESCATIWMQLYIFLFSYCLYPLSISLPVFLLLCAKVRCVEWDSIWMLRYFLPHWKTDSFSLKSLSIKSVCAKEKDFLSLTHGDCFQNIEKIKITNRVLLWVSLTEFKTPITWTLFFYKVSL